MPPVQSALPLRTGPRNDQDLFDWLRLIRSENVGPATFWTLLDRFGSAGDALKALPGLARRAGRRNPVRIAPEADVEAEMERAADLATSIVACGTDGYPPLLAMIDAPPPILMVRGDPAIASPRSVGIVGARNASAAGQKLANRIAHDLGRHGVTVVSGLARGIDTAAHKASLDTGTVAVVAGGVDVIYPKENRQLYDAIIEMGAVISEMPMGAEPLARHFPRRNRLISGISVGVAVIEAAKRSGSLITARFALEQGREVFAVPGSPLDARAQGSNGLLRDGAYLTESAEDILSVLEPQFREPPREPIRLPAKPAAVDANPPDAHDTVASLLGPGPVEIDDLVRLSGLPASTVSSLVLELEIAGRAIRYPGNRVAAAPTD